MVAFMQRLWKKPSWWGWSTLAGFLGLWGLVTLLIGLFGVNSADSTRLLLASAGLGLALTGGGGLALLRSLPQIRNSPELQQLADQRRTLLEVSQSLVSTLSNEVVLERILHSLQRILDYDGCALFVYDREKAALLPYEVVYSSRSLVHIDQVAIQPGQGIIGAVFASGKGELVNNAQADPRSYYIDREHSPAIDHTIAVPLLVNQQKLGVFSVIRRTDPPFSGADYEMVTLFAGYAGLAFENARLYQEERARAELMTGLVQVSENFNRPLSSSEIYTAVGQGARLLLGCPFITVYAAQSGGLDVVWNEGFSDAHIGHMQAPVQAMFARPAALRRLTIFTGQEGVPADSAERQIAEREGFSSLASLPLVYENRLLAIVLCAFTEPHAWPESERETLGAFCRQASIALQTARLYEELEGSYLQTTLALAKAMDARDTYTGDHGQKLSIWAQQVAFRLGCSAGDIQDVRMAALLHDIGKLGVPDAILRKPDALEDGEWEVMRLHPAVGADIVTPVKKLERVVPLIRYHHEKFDGSGYPEGLKGSQIPLGARILKVVDAYGAMTDTRSYRPARPPAAAAAELLRCAGTDFDPHVVEVFLGIVGE
jgi:HD-GYP domain-containing protein (c-di-GMP phosphodiesterase class II)